MNGATLAGILVPLITTIGGGIAWWVNRRDKNKPGIPKTAAELANAQTALGILDKSAARLDRDVARMDAALEKERLRSDKQQEQLDSQQEQLDSQQEQIDRLKALLSHATRYIETLLRAWPPGSTPAPTVPAPLHELIDSTLHPND